VRGDTKEFEIAGTGQGRGHGGKWRVGFSVIETLLAQEVLSMADDLLTECRLLKREGNIDMAFVAVVDTDNLHSDLFPCGRQEAALALAAFGGESTHEICQNAGVGTEPLTMDLGSRVSRKKDLMPPISRVLGDGWTPPCDDS